MAGARPAGIRRVVRRCRGSRRVAGACRCRAGCRKPLRCGGGGSSGTRTRRGSGADGRGAGHGRFRAPNREHTMDPRQHMGGRCTDDFPAIGNHPRARRRGPGNETKAARGEIPDRRQSAWLSGETAPSILPCGLHLARLWPGLLRCGKGGLIDLDQVLKQAAMIDHSLCSRSQASCNCRARAGPGVAGRRYHSSGWSRCERPEPGLQGQVAAVDRACGPRSPSRRPHIPSSPGAASVPSPCHGRRRGRRSRRASAWRRDGGRRRLHRETRRRRGTWGGHDFQRLAMTEHYTNMLPTPTRNNISSNRAQRDKP